jgi:hypothetical protein
MLPGLFIIALLIAYWTDYKNDRKIYGDNGHGVIYLVVIGVISLLILIAVFR